MEGWIYYGKQVRPMVQAFRETGAYAWFYNKTRTLMNQYRKYVGAGDLVPESSYKFRFSEEKYKYMDVDAIQRYLLRAHDSNSLMKVEQAYMFLDFIFQADEPNWEQLYNVKRPARRGKIISTGRIKSAKITIERGDYWDSVYIDYKWGNGNGYDPVRLVAFQDGKIIYEEWANLSKDRQRFELYSVPTGEGISYKLVNNVGTVLARK